MNQKEGEERSNHERSTRRRMSTTTTRRKQTRWGIYGMVLGLSALMALMAVAIYHTFPSHDLWPGSLGDVYSHGPPITEPRSKPQEISAAAPKNNATVASTVPLSTTENDNNVPKKDGGVVNEKKDANCPFKDSPLYRKVYVYPIPGTAEWRGPILSNHSHNVSWPWLALDDEMRSKREAHYDIHAESGQYATELIVRDIMMHPDSCLRTDDPETATLFYIPYLTSTEYHRGKASISHYETSPYAQAVYNATEGDYAEWERLFGLSSHYWKRRNGADHILVFSEPLHGLTHPRRKRGSHHYVHTQRQLRPPIILSVELSRTFVEMYPKCAAKNIVLPYPNADGRFFNGKLAKEAQDALTSLLNLTNVSQSEAALAIEKENSSGRFLSQYYQAGVHGSCQSLRRALKSDYKCTKSSHFLNKSGKKSYKYGTFMSTFCPCPGGDSPSAKRMFDVILAGCIPIILSHDFVWPFSPNVDYTETTLDPSTFSLEWNASRYNTPKRNKRTCQLINATEPDVHVQLEYNISKDDLQKLRQGLERAAYYYGYYPLGDTSLPDNPLAEGVLPSGGAAHALVAALAARANGVRWADCEEELQNVPKNREEPKSFKC